MKVDDSYQTMANLAKAAKLLFRCYLFTALAKLLWLATPQLLPDHNVNMLNFSIFALGFGGGIISWSMAAVGSRYEHFGSVMLFNILTALAVGFVCSK
jgi:hypothetical protein